MKYRRFTIQIFAYTLLLGLLLSGCAPPPAPVSETIQNDQQWRSNMLSARSAFELGHYKSASRLYARALKRARQTDRAEDIADAAFNLAATLIQLGDYPGAEDYLQEAKSEPRRLENTLDEILLLEARLARLQADAERSRDITNRLLRQLPVSERRLNSHARILSGLLACEAGDMALAKQELAMAFKHASDLHPTLAASRAELQGCINLLGQDPLAAASDFDRESALLQQAHQYQLMVNALHKAGSAYAAAGNNQLAADRLFRAARSAYSQKRPQQGQLLLEKAESLAIAADAQLLLENIERLRRTQNGT